MIKHFALLGILPFTIQVAKPQCDISIPSDAMVVSSGGATIAVSDTVIWICPDVTGLALTGSNNTYIMSGFGSVGLSGTNNTAFVKSGCLWYVTGNGNTIYEGFGADAQLAPGSTSTVIECVSMTIDMGNAPTPGCSSVGIGELEHSTGWTATFSGGLLEVTLRADRANYVIMDAMGRMVASGVFHGGANAFDMRAQAAGTYQLIDADRGTIVLRFVKP